MMDMSTILIAAMVLMMVVMCGGMLFGARSFLRRRRGDADD